MKKNNSIFKDIKKMAGSLFSSAIDVKNDLSEYVKEHVETFISGMNFATREELDVLKKMLIETNKELETLKLNLNPKTETTTNTPIKNKTTPKKQPIKTKKKIEV